MKKIKIKIKVTLEKIQKKNKKKIEKVLKIADSEKKCTLNF
jgi:hypothetical protein